MLLYPDHLQNWLDFGHGLLIFLLLGTTLVYWNGSNSVFLGFSRRTNGENGLTFCLLMYPDYLQKYNNIIVTVCRFVFQFCTIPSSWNGSKLVFPGITWRALGRNGLKFYMLMYPDHLQKWIDSDHDLWIFFILTPLWLGETASWPPSELISFLSRPHFWLVFIMNLCVTDWPLAD